MPKAMRVLLGVLAAASAAAPERAGPPPWTTVLKGLPAGKTSALKVRLGPTMSFHRNYFTGPFRLQRYHVGFVGADLMSSPEKASPKKASLKKAIPDALLSPAPDMSWVKGGSLWIKGGVVPRGSLLMIKKRPCRVVDVSSAIVSKLGYRKTYIVAMDIFTGQTFEEEFLSMHPQQQMWEVPIVTLTEYQVMGANKQTGEAVLRKESGDTRKNLKLPTWSKVGEPTEDDKKVADEILKALDDGTRTVSCVVQSACGEEKIIGLRLGKAD